MAFQVFDGTLVGTCPPNGLGTFSASDRSKDDRKSCQEGIGARTTGVPHGKMEQLIAQAKLIYLKMEKISVPKVFENAR